MHSPNTYVPQSYDISEIRPENLLGSVSLPNIWLQSKLVRVSYSSPGMYSDRPRLGNIYHMSHGITEISSTDGVDELLAV